MGQAANLKKEIWDVYASIGKKLLDRQRLKIPGFDTSKSMLAALVFDDVKSEESWKAFCKNSNVANHIDKVVSVESFAPMLISEFSLGIGLIRDFLSTMTYSESSVSSLADFFENDNVTLVTRAPVYFLGIESSYPIRLEEGVELLSPPLSDEYSFSTPYEIDIRPSFVFEHKWFEKKTIAEKGEVISPSGLVRRDLPGLKTLKHLISTLVLLGKSKFNVPFAETKVEAPGVLIGLNWYFHSPPWTVPKGSHMKADEVKPFLQAWTQLRPLLSSELLRKAEWLDTALSRMAIASERENVRDALIDICTSLEALLTHEDTPEIAYRLRNRGAFLRSLGMPSLDAGEIDDARRILSRAYDMRSKFVHGDSIDYERKDIEQTLEKTTDLARQILMKLLVLSNLGDHKKLLVDTVDLAMLSQDKRKVLEGILAESQLSPYWSGSI